MLRQNNKQSQVCFLCLIFKKICNDVLIHQIVTKSTRDLKFFPDSYFKKSRKLINQVNIIEIEKIK